MPIYITIKPACQAQSVGPQHPGLLRARVGRVPTLHPVNSGSHLGGEMQTPSLLGVREAHAWIDRHPLGSSRRNAGAPMNAFEGRRHLSRN